MNDQKLHCVLVMPAYNEEECIEKVVRNWRDEFARLMPEGAFKLVVVNDGSKDKTGKILDELSTKVSELVPVHQPNGGHGVALLTAYRKALELEPDYVFHVDSDDQFLTKDFEPIWKNREKSKFILGWREVRHDAHHRRVITSILRGVIFVCYGAYVRDANIPYRLIKGTYLKGLLNEIPKSVFAPNIFLSVMAVRDGQDTISFPVTHEDRATGQVSIVRWNLLKACFRSFRELVEFRLTLRPKLNRLKHHESLHLTNSPENSKAL